MREIKFRGKSIESNEWVYGDLSLNNEDGQPFIIPETLGIHFVFSDSVGQFTGLKDKNGKEIYEGDIVSIDKKGFYDEGLGVFVWQDFKTSENDQWMIFKGGWKLDTKCQQIWTGRTISVIGNIHDNPELLKP